MEWESYAGLVKTSTPPEEIAFEMIEGGEKVVSKKVQEDVIFLPLCQHLIPTGTYICIHLIKILYNHSYNCFHFHN